MTHTIGPEVSMTLREAVKEVLVLLTGQELTYNPELDRFRAITSHLNRALRSNALELEWSYYSEQMDAGPAVAGQSSYTVVPTYRYRVVNDDAVRLTSDGVPVHWAYFLPRDALHKYRHRDGLWCAYTRTTLTFSKPLLDSMDGMGIELPVMREPTMFRLPADPTEVPDQYVLDQAVDFSFPDLITARAAWTYAQTDPVMQPRVQTLEDSYNSLKYQVMERDLAFTESPYLNEIIVPVQGTIYGETTSRSWPVANRR